MFIGGRVELVMSASLSSGGWKSGTGRVRLGSVRPLLAHRVLSQSLSPSMPLSQDSHPSAPVNFTF